MLLFYCVVEFLFSRLLCLFSTIALLLFDLCGFACAVCVYLLTVDVVVMSWHVALCYVA